VKRKQLHPWEPGFAARYDEPWFKALPVATQRLFREQDVERAAIWRRVKAGELPDSAWLECCQRQVAQNMELAQRRQTVAPDRDRTAFASLLRSWGVDAVEEKLVEPAWLKGGE